MTYVSNSWTGTTTQSYLGFVRFKTDQSVAIQIFGKGGGTYKTFNFGSYSANFLRIGSTMNTVFQKGSWEHFIITYNGLGRTSSSNYKMYINGNPDIVTGTGGFSFGSANINTFGFTQESGDVTRLNGILDEILIYNKALTQAEVGELYQYYQ